MEVGLKKRAERDGRINSGVFEKNEGQMTGHTGEPKWEPLS